MADLTVTGWPACVLPTCHSRNPHQADNTLCCWDCGQKLRARIRDIDTYLRALDGTPRTRGHTGPHRPGYHSRPPADLDQLALTDPRTRDTDDEDRVPAVLTTIHHWAAATRSHCPTAHHQPLTTIGDALILLLTNTGWITQQPNVTAYAEALDFVHGVLRRAAGDAPPPPAATCPCGGPIWLAEHATTRDATTRDDGSRERVGTARCAGCGTTYTGLDLVRLHTTQAQR